MEISEDIGAEVISRMRSLVEYLDETKKERDEHSTNFPKFARVFGERKNSQLHLVLESSLLESLKREAMLKGVSLAEYCRRRLGGGY